MARIDKNGKLCYDPDVENKRHLDIVISLPASGKSSAVFDVLSNLYKACIIDNDGVRAKTIDFFGFCGTI